MFSLVEYIYFMELTYQHYYFIIKTPMRYYLLSILWVLSACSLNESSDVSFGESVQDETLHALMSERIDNLFRRIEVLAFDQNRTLPELDDERQRTANEIAESAETLSGVADELAQLVSTLNLTEPRQQQFQILARNLLEASNNVARTAVSPSSLDLAESINALQLTCASCHNLYRDQ